MVARPRLSTPDEEEIVAGIRLAGGPSRTFFILMLLSTVIASFGLLSNSAATVIGAMIVAPLMGPILGAALALVQADIPEFRRSLVASTLGVLVCIGTAGLVVLLAGVDNVDFRQSEIVARTRPTLYDLVVGLAAGLAGAFATVNRKISGSIAGVAIAVALVPPLAVAGLCLTGARHDATLLSAAGGSFMLFMANYLTIELAAVLVFSLAGLGHPARLLRSRRLLGGLGVQLLVLSFTLYFLGVSLQQIVAERRWTAECRQVINEELAGIPGAILADLRVQRGQGSRLEVQATVRSPQDIAPPQVAHLRQQLAKRLGREVSLVVSTVLSVYYSDRGQLYLPQRPDEPRQRALRLTEDALRRALQVFPSVELASFRLLASSEQLRRLLVTLRSPYEFDSSLVAELQVAATAEYRRLSGDEVSLELIVRSVVSRDYDARGAVETEQVLTAEQRFRRDLRERLDIEMRALVAQVPGSLLISTSFDLHDTPDDDDAQPPLPTPVDSSTLTPAERQLEVRAVVRTRSPLAPATVTKWQEHLASALSFRVTLLVDNRLGASVTAAPTGARPK